MIKKIIKVIFGLIIVLSIFYSLIWVFSLKLFTKTINQNFANHQFAIDDEANSYFISFKKAENFGFPFNWGIKLIGVEEDGISSKIIYHSPIILGYNLIKQEIFIKYSGSINGAFKPLTSNFGATIDCEDYSITVKLPITINLIKTLINSNSTIFELINYIDIIKYSTKNIEIHDNISNELLYSEKSSQNIIKINHPKYVKNLQELLNNFPNKLYVFIDKNIEQSVQAKKIVAPTSVLYGIFLPIAFNFKGEIDFLSEQSCLDDILNNFTVKFNQFSFSNNSIKSTHKINFTKSYLQDDKNYHLIYDGQIKLNNNFFKILLNTLINFEMIDPSFDWNQSLDLNNFILFENNNYTIKLDSLLHKTPFNYSLRINNFSVFDENSGFQFNNILDFNTSQNSNRGTVSLANIEKLGEMITKMYSKQLVNNDNFTIYKDTIIEFLKNLSQNPNSASNSLIIEFDINISDYFNSKIGNYKLTQIYDLFLSILYNNAVKINPELKYDKVQIIKLIPQLKHHEELIKIMENIHLRTDK